jgi:hypothetical protein
MIMFTIIITSIILIALIVGTITDIKTREVPDWINFSLVGLGLGIRLIVSLISNDFSFIFEGLIGFGVFFVIGLIMFYTGQWGGGDSKMLIGLGALMGIPYTNWTSLFVVMKMPFLSFFINSVIVGSLYGLVWSFYVALLNRKRFLKEFKKAKQMISDLKWVMIILFIILAIFAIIVDDIFVKILIVALIIGVYSSIYLLVFVKAVEKSCMIKYVSPLTVTEGDWIAKDVYVDGKFISGPKDLGIERKQLRKLINFYKKGKIKKVLIKVGIPFVPSFLIAYVLTLFYGNLLLAFI